MEEARLPMVWGSGVDYDLLDFYVSLIAFRKTHPVLWQAKRQTVLAQPGCFAYSHAEDGTHLITVLNLSLEKNHVALPAGSGKLVLSTDQACQYLNENGQLAVDLAPLSGAIFSIEE